MNTAWSCAQVTGKRLGKITNMHAGNRSTILSAVLGDHELYHVKADLSETENVAMAFPQKVAELSQQLQRRYTELLQGSHVWVR